MPAEMATLLNVTVTTAVSAVAQTAVAVSMRTLEGPFYVRPVSLILDSNFTYGSGGTTGKAWVQTSIDGTLWTDIANFAVTTASLRRMYHLTNAAVTSIYTPTDGTLSDNTSVNGLLGAQFRVKLTTTGTYAGGTTWTIKAYAL